MSKIQLPQEFESYVKDSPEFNSILEIFGETMKSYQEALLAMGATQPSQIVSGNTSINEIVVNSASTKDVKLTA